MTLSRDEAGAQLAAIDDVIQRMKQSRIYRVSGDIIMLWGVLEFVRYAAINFAPALFSKGWFAIDAFGVGATILMLRRAGPGRALPASRVIGVYALLYGFGFLWSGPLGHFGGRETMVFWHTLFLLCYSLAGLWFGVGFLAIGLGITAAIVAVYYFAGAAFWLAMAIVTGFGFILCGLWMRRA